jgi:prolipoprotein diacylglyceryl transferase
MHSLWLFIAIALIVGTYAFIKLGLTRGLKLQFLTENAFYILITALLGARVFAIIFNWTTFFYEYSFTTFLQIFKVWDKGLSLWGGILVGTAMLYHLCRKNDQNFMKWLDSLIPAFLIGLAIAAIGGFLDGTWYGNETALPWGVNFESPSIKYTVPIHPTQIYMLLMAAAVAIIAIITKDLKFFEKDGRSAILSVSLFSLLYFFQEFLRGDDVTMVLGMRLPQILAAIILISSLIFYFVHYNSARTGKSGKSKK